MPFPDQEQVLNVLKPHFPALTGSLRNAWSTWLGSEFVGRWNKRSRANFVWEETRHAAVKQLTGVSGVAILARSDTTYFVVDQQVLFRFKKGDHLGVSGNVKTKESQAYHDHLQPPLNLPDLMRVEVVYQLNELETSILDIIIVARQGVAVLWKFSLLHSDARVIPLPLQTEESEAPTPQRKAVVRSAIQKKGEVRLDDAKRS
ncbi:hypothetical protein [Pseudomonas sp. MYb185]|uniref:hypothetical protein n=1 Tax=Pseudomonas sp. MYb185 TaxID=1848729 RepID=UPI000CFBBABC|nr:hypothetical protein [Pseudomonas sp. MYb185]PRB80535.1 hypothetical protein CQ007_12515 [Pseudomonas sp. MYb185]